MTDLDRIFLDLESTKVEALANSLEGTHEVIRAVAEGYGQMLGLTERILPIFEQSDDEAVAELREALAAIVDEGRDWLLAIKRLDSSIPALLRAVREEDDV